MKKLVPFVLILFLSIALFLVLKKTQWTEEELRSSIITKVESESPESFLVTGSLEINADITEESNRSFIIPVLFMPVPVNMGKTTTNLKIPGKVAYGFNVRDLKAEDINVAEDGVIEVDLPELSTFSVEPYLDQAEIQTEVGWARMHSKSGQVQEEKALGRVNETLRNQARSVLDNSQQPQINTAEALQAMLLPVTEALGIENPQFRFKLGNGLFWNKEIPEVLEAEG